MVSWGALRFTNRANMNSNTITLNSYSINYVIITKSWHIQTPGIFKPCQITKMMRHIEYPGIVKTVQTFSGIFRHIQQYQGMCRHFEAYSDIIKAY